VIDPIALKIGPFAIHWYGLLIVTGALLGAYVATLQAKLWKENPELVWDLLTIVLIFGIVGARLYHVFSRPSGGFVGWPYYKQHPIEIIAFWHGGFQGLGIYGAIIGGFIGLLVFALWRKINVWRWLDIAVPGLLVGQILGRFGNFVNQELYGPPTTLPWGIKIDAAHRYGAFTNLAKYPVATTRFHPTFLYEATWNFIGLLLFLYFTRKLLPKLREGDVFFAYLIWYPLGRLWVETFRPDAWTIDGIATAQIFSIIGIIIGIAGLIIRHRHWRPGGSGAVMRPDTGQPEPTA